MRWTLNALWSEMVRCVEAKGGIINKFLGDGFLAVFGVPSPLEEPAAAAVVSARELLEIVAKLKRSSARFAELDIGLAVHYGNVLSGLVGAANRRKKGDLRRGDRVRLANAGRVPVLLNKPVTLKTDQMRARLCAWRPGLGQRRL